MDGSVSQMDKLLLTLFVSVLVAFITAALSIVRLVNDKENKTTDYRQSWTDSLRKCFADLISNINLLASGITDRLSTFDQISNFRCNEKQLKDVASVTLTEKEKTPFDEKINHEDSHVREVRRNLYQSYALARLHFKPNDLSFSRVEQKFDVIVEMLEQLAKLDKSTDEPDRRVLRQKIHAAAIEITAYSRDILKTEWEGVKKGERAYQSTKKWSLVGGGVALFILLIFGLSAGWEMLKGNLNDRKMSGENLASNREVVAEVNNGERVLRHPDLTSGSQNSQVVNLYPPTSYTANSKAIIADKNKVQSKQCVTPYKE